MTPRASSSVLLAVVVVATLAATAVPAHAWGGPIPPPRHGRWLGAYVNPNGGAVHTDEITAFERQIHRRLSVDMHYYGWSGASQSFPSGFDRFDVRHGRIPLIAWSGTRLDSILNGSQDALIRARARSSKAFHHRFFLRWAYEMNGDWNPWDGSHNNTPGTHDGPAKFVRAWRHIHDIFRQAGAMNVAWVWCPNDRDLPSVAWNHWTHYYPGDAYVDWVCGDGYNWGNTQSWSSWMPFARLFVGLYRDYARRKPMLIGETACASQGGNKAEWFLETWKALSFRYPDIKAIAYIDAGWAWTVNTSKPSLVAFRRMANSSLFRQRRDTRAPRLGTLAAVPTRIRAGKTARLNFSLTEPARVTVLVRNSARRVVRRIPVGPVASGSRSIRWNGRNDAGRRVRPGLYRWTVRATDPSGNRSRAGSYITIG